MSKKNKHWGRMLREKGRDDIDRRSSNTRARAALRRVADHDDWESLPLRPRSHHYRADRSWPDRTRNSNLKPLMRWIAAQVGRPWNKVWSEFCAQAGSGLPGDAARRVVWEEVEHTVVLVDGVPHRPLMPSWPRQLRLRKGTLYVHPVDGLLKRAR